MSNFQELRDRVEESDSYGAAMEGCRTGKDTLASAANTVKHAGFTAAGALRTVANVAGAGIDTAGAVLKTIDYAATRISGRSGASDQAFEDMKNRYTTVGTDLKGSAHALRDTASDLAETGLNLGKTGMHFTYTLGWVGTAAYFAMESSVRSCRNARTQRSQTFIVNPAVANPIIEVVSREKPILKDSLKVHAARLQSAQP